MTTSPLIFIVLLLPLISTTSREPILYDDAARGPNTTSSATPVEAAEDLTASGSPTSPKTAKAVVTKNMIDILIGTAVKMSIANRHSTSGQTASNLTGISSYCMKSQSASLLWYPPTPIECCDRRGQCNEYIEPGETKHGLTNPNKQWRRRSCYCDKRLWDCVTKGLSQHSIHRAMMFGFKSERCYRRHFVVSNGKLVQQGYEFVNLVNTLGRPR